MAIQRTGLGTTSLGAVGGPRGTAAGALRILVEFLTQYDAKAVSQLRGDLQQLEQAEEQADRRTLARQQALETVTKRRIAAENQLAAAIARLPSASGRRSARSEFRAIEALRLGSPSDRREANLRFQALLKNIGLTERERQEVEKIFRLRASQRGFEEQLNRLAFARRGILEQEEAVQQRLTAFERLRSQVPSRLAGLAVGAVGGIVGGAILGVGFTAIQAVIDRVGEFFLDIIDPARHAREALEGVAAGIRAIKDESEGLSDEQAALRFLRELGIKSDSATALLLARAVAAQDVIKSNEELAETLKVLGHVDELEQQGIRDRAKLLIEQARLEGNLVTIQERRGYNLIDVIDKEFYEAEAARQVAQLHKDAAAAAEQQAAAERRLEAAAQLATFAQQALANALQRRAGVLTAPIDAQIRTLEDSDPTSARTRALEAQIEALQEAGSGRGQQQQLQNIAEERAIILLRQRLRLLGATINLEQFEGKFLLEAINAKIKALDKQAQAQDRLNRLLDLQFRASQQLRRQEGESISDFLERRAQHNRSILQEQRQLELDRIREGLQELQEKTQDEVALQELAERRKNALAQQGSSARIKALQKELEASRKADRDALQAKIEALQAQKKAIEQAAEDAAHFASTTANEEIRQATRAAKTVEEIAILGGQARGLAAAKEFLSALLISGALGPGEAREVREALQRITATLNQLSNRRERIVLSSINTTGRPIPVASGGFIPLNGGSTPFGQNFRFGEEGTEAGMLVLPSRLTKQLQGNREPSIGSITINRSDDPLRDQWRFKRAVREAVEEILG